MAVEIFLVCLACLQLPLSWSLHFSMAVVILGHTMQNHFFPGMDSMAPELRNACRFELRLRCVMVDAQRSPFFIAEGCLPSFTSEWFWKIFPHGRAWATVAAVSRDARNLCAARLQLLQVSRLPSLPCMIAFVSFQAMLEQQFFAKDDEGKCFAGGSKCGSESARHVFEQVAVGLHLQQGLELQMASKVQFFH